MMRTTKPSRDLCIMACIFCREPQFHAWLKQLDKEGGIVFTPNEAGAKTFITSICGVKSRNDLDTSADAAQAFHDMVRKPYLAWKNPGSDPDGMYDGFAPPGVYP